MDGIQERLIQRLMRHGFQARLVASGHLEELRREIAALRQAGILDETLYRRYLSGWQFDYADRLPEARSLIVVAAPQPLTRLDFRWRGRLRQVVIPPTYPCDEDQRAIAIVAEELQSGSYRWLKAGLPKKLLAVRSGLSRYGRNNISYVDGMGSFYTIMVFVSDLQVTQDAWREATQMPECAACQACLRSCPTHCIDPDRFVIHAERCLTFCNENSGAFPDWANGHNALVGCMRCQIVCPQNRDRLRTEEINEAFSEAEIAAILDGTGLERLPEKTRLTLARLGLAGYCHDNILARNLRILLEK